MFDAKPVGIPLTNHFELSNNQCQNGRRNFRDVKGALCQLSWMFDICNGIYYIDLAHAVSLVSKYSANLSKQHWRVIKWIFRYLRDIMECVIMFGRQHDDVSVRDTQMQIMHVTGMTEGPIHIMFSHSQVGLYVGDQWCSHLWHYPQLKQSIWRQLRQPRNYCH